MFKGTHYGEEVYMAWYNENKRGLNQVIETLEKDNLEFKLLPIHDDEHNYDVFKYKKDDEWKYCIVCFRKSCYFMMRKLPEDMDIMKLVQDVYDQNQKPEKEPMIMRSKFRELIDPALVEAQNKLEDFKECEMYIYELFKRKSEDTMSDEDKEVDEWDWDEEKTPVEKDADFRYMYKVAAELLNRKGYDYEYLKKIAELDHHDIDFWKSELDRFFDGYYYYSTLDKYREH